MQSYERALAIKPDYANAQANLEALLREQGRSLQAAPSTLAPSALTPQPVGANEASTPKGEGAAKAQAKSAGLRSLTKKPGRTNKSSKRSRATSKPAKPGRRR